jgi:hypothetical protein
VTAPGISVAELPVVRSPQQLIGIEAEHLETLASTGVLVGATAIRKGLSREIHEVGYSPADRGPVVEQELRVQYSNVIR